MTSASVAGASVAHVGRGRAAAVDAPLYYSNPSPDDAGASRALYRKIDLVELPPNVPITAIEFDKRRSGGVTTGSFTILLKNTIATSLSTSPLSDATAGATQVFTTTATAIPAADGWVHFDLASPFTYTGDALEVVTIWDSNTGARTLPLLWGVASTNPTSTRLVNYGPDPLDSSTVLGAVNPPVRPNTRFVYTPPALPWCAVEVGELKIVNGATYGNGAIFGTGTTTSQRLRIVNRGGAPLVFDATPITFTNLVGTTVAVVTGPSSGTLAQDESVVVELAHTPTGSSGATSYTVNIGSNAGPFTYTLSGVTGTPSPEIDANICDEGVFPNRLCSRVPTGSHIYLGEISQNTPTSFVVEIANTGAGALTNTGLVSSNPACTIASQVTPTVTGGSDALALVTCNFATLGTDGTQLALANNDATESNYTMLLDVTIVEPAPVPEGPFIDGDWGGGADAVELTTITPDLVIYNRGDEPLVISSITMTCDVGCTVGPALANPGTIGPGLNVTVPTTLTIGAFPGTYAATITIASNDTMHSPLEVPFDGNITLEGVPDPDDPNNPATGDGAGCCDSGGSASSSVVLAIGVAIMARRRRADRASSRSSRTRRPAG